jgi:hypothetical protein
MKTVSILLAVAASVLVFCEQSGRADSDADDDDDSAVSEGTGSYVSHVTRTATPVTSCVELIKRVGSIGFTGFITSAESDGKFESRALRDFCAEPVQGPTRQHYELRNATVAGRTGTLIIDAEGVFEGDATSSPGARPRYHLTLRGVGGKLKGLRGEGMAVGFALGTSSSNAYWARIWFED